MKGHGEKFSRKQESAIAALLQYPTVSAAAKAVGVNDVTLWRWMKHPAFADRYRQARAEAVDQAMARLQTASETAVVTLVKVMGDPTAPAAARVQAAKVVLDMALNGVALSDVMTRLQALLQTQDQAPTLPAGAEGNGHVSIN